MNYSELLHDFVENSLSTQHEETLFQALAVDEELRFELKYLLTLRDTIREDEEAGFVPLATTDSIFKTLGYTAPIAVGAGSGVAASQIGLISLIKTWGGYLVASLVGTLLATSVFLMVDDSREVVFANQKTTTGDNVEASSSVAANTEEASNPVLAETEGMQERRTSVAPRTIQHSIQAEAPKRQKLSTQTETTTTTTTRLTAQGTTQAEPTTTAKNVTPQDASTDDDPTITAAQTTSDNSISSQELNHVNSENREAAAMAVTPIDNSEKVTEPRSSASLSIDKIDNSVNNPVNYIKQQPAPFSAHVRGITVPVDLETSQLQLPVADPGLENVALGISYPLSPHFSVVLEGGKESYLLSFTTPKDDGRVFLHEVQPSVIWGAAGIRYNWLTTSRFTPFGQFLIGSSEAGLMGRGMVGTNWSITDRIGLTAGAEYSLVGYRYLGDLNFSDRVGLTYGLTIDFGR
ncbi:MAG: hypothetical protein KDD67_11010 [Ignavibacteriae bacterium]|nr:hypothetical protein [Ignavibacteriota bacterium]MCB9215819.1 hypothetical protein [Ignavibacteria bacterium]